MQKRKKLHSAKKYISIFTSCFISSTLLTGCIQTQNKTTDKMLALLKNSDYLTAHYSVFLDEQIDSDIQNNASSYYLNIINNEVASNIDVKTLKNNICGLIVTPTDLSYEGIYETINYVKDFVYTYNLQLPIYYNIDKYMDSASINMNLCLGDMFCSKLTANGCYVGFYGSESNLKTYDEAYKKVMKSKAFDLYDKIVRVEEDNLEYTNDLERVESTYKGKYNGIELMNGSIYYKKDLSFIINKYHLNSYNNFVNDYEYIVKEDDTLEQISSYFNIDYQNLLTYNNLTSTTTLTVGDKIYIPNNFINYQKKSQTNKQNSNQNIGNILKGIKVNHSNGLIDWQETSKYIDYAIIRYMDDRMGSNNTYVTDTCFEYNMENCEKLNIPIGIYWQTTATTNKEMFIEVNKLINDLKKYTIEFPVYISFDEENYGYLEHKDVIEYGCRKLKQAGYKPGIMISADKSNNYTNFKYTTCLTYPNVENDDFPISHYPTTTNPMYEFSNQTQTNGVIGESNVLYSLENVTDEITNSKGYKLQLKRKK